ncbi:MAG: Filamentation induced by cAMP protein Fic [Burkholderiaceae bacterium]|jgi:hypothetical protein|nr:MAG: Filamentation induced by cAMP protein Fic [Burkholderiaceae bacterium]
MIGYEFLLSKIPLRMPPPARPARIMPVTRVEEMPDLLAVPRHVAPDQDASVLDHVLFALKHETLQLAFLHEALKLVPAEALVQALTAQRQGAYLRKAAFLWEKANGTELQLPWGTTGGNYVDMFDPEDYYTGTLWERSQRLRVNFNGIGPYDFCPVVRRDPALQDQGEEILKDLKAWSTNPDNAGVLDRVMGWAYLSETRDSYAIENEVPSPGKERAFLQAMEHLRDRTPLSEEYLVALQNVVVSNPLKTEAGFRRHQNWLQRGGHGALAVRYVPPPPEAMPSLMEGLMRMANARDDTPPLIKAALVSFGFVFIHPFIDGNGRLSRLLAHHSLNYNDALPTINGNPAILPLSVAMKKNESGYLATLEAFSKPARDLWDVTYIDGNEFAFDFKSSAMTYAHWAGQHAAAFVTACARSALRQSLIDEAAFIHAYDQAFERIDREFDLPDRTINLLIQWIQQNNGRMPERRKNATEIILLTPEMIDRIEAIVAGCFQPTAQA